MPARPTEEVSEVIVLVHGIRDHALWHDEVRAALEKAGFVVEATNYGRFDLLKFLFPLDHFRTQAVDTVETQIRDIIKLYPNAKLSFIAHSFGTYVLARLLQKRADLVAHRIVFCGSVLHYDFPFEQIADRFSQPIVNEVGTDDKWPALAASATWGYGSAGTFGFKRPRVRDRWHNGASHGYFLNKKFANKFWIPFFQTGTIVSGSSSPQKPPSWLTTVSILKLRWLFVLALAAVLTHFVVRPLTLSSMLSVHVPVEGAVKLNFLRQPISELEQAGKATCPLRLIFGPECNNFLTRYLFGREFVTMRLDSRIYDLAICRTFEAQSRDPIAVFSALHQHMPACLSVERKDGAISVSLVGATVKQSITSLGDPAYVCGC